MNRTIWWVVFTVLAVGILVLCVPMTQYRDGKGYSKLRAKHDVQQICTALVACFQECGSLPECEGQTGVEFVRVLSGENTHRIVFMEFSPGTRDKGFLDPWGTLYRIDAQTNGAFNVKVLSFGPNKHNDMGQKDDIVATSSIQPFHAGDEKPAPDE